MKIKLITIAIIGLIMGLFNSGCKTYENLPELASYVEIDRFMGTWYVHGYSPTFLDREAYNATETYELEEGSILTTYRFRDGAFDGKVKLYHPVGKVTNEETNAEWSMRFFKVFAAPYLVLYVDDEYEYTLIGHPNRKMAWLMSKSPEITEEKYAELMGELEKREFVLDDFRRVPHQWPET